MDHVSTVNLNDSHNFTFMFGQVGHTPFAGNKQLDSMISAGGNADHQQQGVLESMVRTLFTCADFVEQLL